MQYYYGDKNILRALDEAEFWKHQEIEHITVIKLVTQGLEKQYVDKLNEFEKSFNLTHGVIIRFIESNIRSKDDVNGQLREKMLEWIEHAVLESKHFVDFLENLLNTSSAVHNNLSSQTVIKHMIRESQYFIGIDQLILS